MLKEGEACLAPTHLKLVAPISSNRPGRQRSVGGDACVALPLQPCMLKEGEACLAPTHLKSARSPAQRRSDACAALQLQPCMLKEAEACLAPTHLKLVAPISSRRRGRQHSVGATHASPCH